MTMEFNLPSPDGRKKRFYSREFDQMDLEIRSLEIDRIRSKQQSGIALTPKEEAFLLWCKRRRLIR